MRRYNRYKICKTNFYFYFYSSRIFKFNRPKWNILKDKLKFLKNKIKYNTKHVKYVAQRFYKIPFLFKSLKRSFKYTSKKTAVCHVTCTTYKRFNFLILNFPSFKVLRTFEYSFYN
jgi:hypothetical protein